MEMSERALIRVMILLLLPMLLAGMSIGAVASSALQSPLEYRSCTVHIAAVSSAGGGVLGNLTVTVVYPGHGRVYISTSPAAEVDTQGSARAAAFAASLLAGVNMLNYDFYYDIESPSIIVGGPSAGAEMAAATYMLLTGGSCNSTIVATGMIQPDTTIGPVGGLKEKLEAVASGGGKIFVIPAGQENYTYYVTKIERKGPFTFITRQPVTVNLPSLGKKLGVRVYTAATLYDLVYIESHGYPPLYPRVDMIRALKVPGYANNLVIEYYNESNKTLNIILSNIINSKYNTVKNLAQKALQLTNTASNLANKKQYYAAYLVLEQALVYARTGLVLQDALNDNLNVTAFVNQVNQTITGTWNNLTRINTTNLDINKFYILLKSYEAIGLASYYYSLGLSRLDQKDGSYYIPWSILFGLKLEGLYDQAIALSLTEIARYWLNLAEKTPSLSTKIDQNELNRLALLLEANAKTLTAYTETLLQETSQSTDPLQPALYLVEQAISAQNSLQRAAYSLEAIARVTRVIQESFPMQTNRTLTELNWLLAARLKSSPTSLVNLTLEGELAAETPIEKLSVSSKIILELWTLTILAGYHNATSIGVGIGIGGSGITPPVMSKSMINNNSKTTSSGSSSIGGLEKTGIEREPGKDAMTLIAVLVILVVIISAFGFREERPK